VRAVRRLLVASIAFALPIAVTAFADDPHTRVVVIPTATAVAPDAAPDADSFTPSSNPVDPAPIVSREQWIWDLRWSKGDVYLLAVRPWDAGGLRATPRVMGRFAIELFAGKVLIERVRFDFPGLGAPEGDAGHFALPSFQTKLTTRIGVIFPQTKNGNKLELVDRATGERWTLPWPPNVDAGPP
jgi:hypothetical protein